jgi:hypothetical protein
MAALGEVHTHDLFTFYQEGVDASLRWHEAGEVGSVCGLNL